MHEAKEVLRIELPAHEKASLPLKPGEEPFDQPASRISAKSASILRNGLAAIGSVRCDHLDAVVTRADAAKIGGVGVRIIRYWDLRFNTRGPDGLLDGKSPLPKLNDARRQAIARMIESGPIPAVLGVVRWRLIEATAQPPFWASKSGGSFVKCTIAYSGARKAVALGGVSLSPGDFKQGLHRLMRAA